MEVYKNLYLSEDIENEDYILKMISEGIAIYNLYLICIEKKSNNIFEILESSEIFKYSNKNKEYLIIGMCFGREKAFEIIKNIFEEYLKKGKDIKKIKNNFLNYR